MTLPYTDTCPACGQQLHAWEQKALWKKSKTHAETCSPYKTLRTHITETRRLRK